MLAVGLVRGDVRVAHIRAEGSHTTAAIVRNELGARYACICMRGSQRATLCKERHKARGRVVYGAREASTAHRNEKLKLNRAIRRRREWTQTGALS